MTRNPEDEWRGADFIRIERAKHLIGAHYRGELRCRLEAPGYATVETMVRRVPGFEIAGYDKATLRAFSTRRAEALAWVKECNLDELSATVMQQAAPGRCPEFRSQSGHHGSMFRQRKRVNDCQDRVRRARQPRRPP